MEPIVASQYRTTSHTRDLDFHAIEPNRERSLEMSHTMTVEQPHHTVNDVAALIRMHRNSVYNHIHSGDFPGAYRTAPGRGGEWRIPQAAVDAFIQRGTPTPNDG